MLTAVKGNREAKINEDQKEEYLRAGYDVIDEKGNRTSSPSRKVSYAEYEKLLNENKKLKKVIADAKKETDGEKKAGA